MRAVHYRRLMKHGGSLVVAIPRHMPRDWHLKAGDFVAIEQTDANRVLIYPAKEATDAKGPLPRTQYVYDTGTTRASTRRHRQRKARRARR